MQEDFQAIQLVEKNFGKANQRETMRAEREAREFADRERLVLCISRMLSRVLMAFVGMCIVNLAVENNLLAWELGMLLSLPAVLYMGFCMGRFREEVKK